MLHNGVGLRSYPIRISHRDRSAAIRPVGTVASLVGEPPFYLNLVASVGIAGRDRPDVAFEMCTCPALLVVGRVYRTLLCSFRRFGFLESGGSWGRHEGLLVDGRSSPPPLLPISASPFSVTTHRIFHIRNAGELPEDFRHGHERGSAEVHSGECGFGGDPVAALDKGDEGPGVWPNVGGGP